jgi:cell division septation protein DedD
LLRNVTETVAARTTTLIASLTYSRRLSGTTDVLGSWSYWRTATANSGSRVQPFVELGIRQRFDGLPAVFGGSGTISGVVFADDDLDGRTDGHGVAAEVELDGTRRQRTGDDGTFAFKVVGRGPHHVVARIPEKPEAYFTTASRQEAAAGDRVAFGVASTPARLLGRVINDAGGAIGGVRFVIRRDALRHEATSASDGRFAFAAAPGDWELAIVPDSVPAGHSVTEARPRIVTLARVAPAAVETVLRVHRSIEGHAAAGAEIHVDPPGRVVRADGDGRFAVRSVPSGTVTVTSKGVTRRVDIPLHPSTTAVDLREPAAKPIHAGRTVPDVRGVEHVVQVGAYRVHDNAATVAARARAAGVEVVTERSGTWTLVRVRPAGPREAADKIAAVLRQAGLEAVVMKAR